MKARVKQNKSPWDALSEFQEQFHKLLDKDMGKMFSNISTLQTYCIEANYQDMPEDKQRELREIISDTRRMIRLERWVRG